MRIPSIGPIKIVLFSFLLINHCLSASMPKLYLPIREIDRPLSLPPRTWKMDLGFIGIPGVGQSGRFMMDADERWTSLEIPHLQLGNRWELYFLMPSLKLYAVKNVCKTDSTIELTGLNFAFIGGIAGFYFSNANGFGWDIPLGLGYQLKFPVNSFMWFDNSLDGYVMFRPNRSWQVIFDAGPGFQITNKFSIIPHVSILIFQEHPIPVTSADFTKLLEYHLDIPLDLKINFNTVNGMMFRVGLIGLRGPSIFYRNIDFIGVPLGIQYSWHW